MAYENTNFKSIVDVDITVCVFSEKNTKKRSRSELFTMNISCTNEESKDLYICEYCARSYNSEKQLKIHIRCKHHKKEAEAFMCSDCKKTFVHRWELNKHMFIHIQEPLFECATCGQKFKRRKALVHHYEMFHDENQKLLFQCKDCPRTFSSKSNLTRHEKIHVKSELKCLLCDISFNRVDNYKRHLKRQHSSN